MDLLVGSPLTTKRPRQSRRRFEGGAGAAADATYRVRQRGPALSRACDAVAGDGLHGECPRRAMPELQHRRRSRTRLIGSLQDVMGCEPREAGGDAEHAELRQLRRDALLRCVECGEEVQVDEQPVGRGAGENRDDGKREVLLYLREGGIRERLSFELRLRLMVVEGWGALTRSTLEQFSAPHSHRAAEELIPRGERHAEPAGVTPGGPPRVPETNRLARSVDPGSDDFVAAADLRAR